jgi:2-octaprenyl-6-methoxyphenol hydroxylase
MDRTEVLVVGGGPVGCALALGLRQAGRGVAILERRPRQAGSVVSDAFRPIALSHASRLILERLGAWAPLRVTPIGEVHVSQLGAPGRTLLRAADADVPALGYVVEYGALNDALAERARAAGIFWLDGAEAQRVDPTSDDATLRYLCEGRESMIAARCVAHAEGTGEGMREHSYGQEGIVTLIETATGNGNGNEKWPAASRRAYERFTPDGPLALLPYGDQYAVVWSLRAERARELAAADEDAFLNALVQTIGRRIGTPRSAGPRTLQPLALRLRPSRISARQVYIGNAAQTLHPVAGQGLNLGLRDAWDLAELCCRSADPGAQDTLSAFAALRRFDLRATVGVTDALLRAFGGTHPLLRAGRCVALTALDLLPPARKFFARRMIFGPSAIP